MRGIKFRVWDGEMHDVRQIQFSPSGKFTARKYGKDQTGRGMYINTDSSFLMQYTGLKDKNGVDIYEGDILDFEETEWGGKFDPEIVTMDKLIGDWALCGSPSDISEWRQVIGNIHQNPELMESSN